MNNGARQPKGDELCATAEMRLTQRVSWFSGYGGPELNADSARGLICGK